MTDYVTTWWKKVGETDWEDIPGGHGQQKWSLFQSIATGEQLRSDQLPIGALFAMDRSDCKGPNDWPPAGYDGLAITCVCIGNSGPDSRHNWHIDYRASNCTKPNDKDHRCWVRHGTVGDKLTVDKRGNTCAAGAGSFWMDNGRWHGFLQNGVLVQK